MIYWVVFALITDYPCLKSEYALYVRTPMSTSYRLVHNFLLYFCQCRFCYSSSDLLSNTGRHLPEVWQFTHHISLRTFYEMFSQMLGMLSQYMQLRVPYYFGLCSLHLWRDNSEYINGFLICAFVHVCNNKICLCWYSAIIRYDIYYLLWGAYWFFGNCDKTMLLTVKK